MGLIGMKTPSLRSYLCEGNLSGSQYKFVKVGTLPNSVVPVTAASDIPVGVVQSFDKDGTDGDACAVAQVGGGAFLKVAAAMVAGVAITTNAAGEGIAAVATNRVSCEIDAIGRTTAAGDVVEVILKDYIKA